MLTAVDNLSSRLHTALLLVQGAVLAILEYLLRGERRMMADNIFQKIIDRQIPAKIIYEDAHSLAFHDVHPQAPVHVLIIPRKVIRTHDDVTPEDAHLLGHLHLVATKVAAQLGLGTGYRLVLNCRESAGQTVPHLHLHLLGGRAFGWPPG